MTEYKQPLSPAERARRGEKSKWVMRPDGTWRPPPDQERFIEEWCLAMPYERPTQAEWAQRNGIGESTVAGWKRNPRFRAELQRRLDETWTHPDRVGPIINSLYETAISGGPQGVKAAETYLKFIGAMRPAEMNVNLRAKPIDVSSLSDAELMGMVEQVELERAPEDDEYEYDDEENWDE